MPQLALLATTLVWGATFPATKAALAQLPPLSFLFVRFLLGALLAVAAAWALEDGEGRVEAGRWLGVADGLYEAHRRIAAQPHG